MNDPLNFHVSDEARAAKTPRQVRKVLENNGVSVSGTCGKTTSACKNGKTLDIPTQPDDTEYTLNMRKLIWFAAVSLGFLGLSGAVAGVFYLLRSIGII